jgi:drug/metabolite transporter (DMT)-like permease
MTEISERAPARAGAVPAPRAAVLRVAAGAALLSTTSIFVVLAGVAPTVSAFYRMLFGGAMLLAWTAARGAWRPLTRSDVWLLVLPAAGFAADLILWHRSILWIGPGVSTLLGNIQVFILALVGFALYRERLGPGFVPGMLAAVAGLWLLVGVHWSLFDAQHRLGVWYGLGSGLAYTVYLLSFRRALSGRTELPAAQFLGLMSLLCAALLGAWAWGEGDAFALAGLRSWAALLSLAFVGQLLAWLLMVRALPLVPASLVGLLLLLQPALAFVMDVVLFRRPTAASDWAGLALALGGILLGALRPSRPA